MEDENVNIKELWEILEENIRMQTEESGLSRKSISRSLIKTA
jgi:hypothetical protein